VDDLEFNNKHFLEVCQRYADKSGRLADNSPFKSLAKLNYLIGIPIMDNKNKLENLLLGKYMPYDRTNICLRDFLRTKTSTNCWERQPTRAGRRLFLEAAQNFQLVMGVFFGEEYKECFLDVINILFDNNDILQDYDDVYIQSKLEMAISDFFNDIFKERVSCNYPEHNMKSEKSCAELLRKYLREEMRYAMRMGEPDNNWEIFPHPKYYSVEGVHTRIISNKEGLGTKTKEIEKKKEKSDLCEWHLGNLLDVRGFNGKVIQCRSGVNCRFKHDVLSDITRVQAERTISKVKGTKLQAAFEDKLKKTHEFKK
jgi:hypothetical protein